MSPVVFLLLLFMAFGLFGLVSDRVNRSAALHQRGVERRRTLADFMARHR